MDKQRVPDLERMNEQQAQDFLVEMFTHLSAEAEYELRHEDHVMEMPQSRERIRGRENMRAFQEAYPTPPTNGGRSGSSGFRLQASGHRYQGCSTTRAASRRLPIQLSRDLNDTMVPAFSYVRSPEKLMVGCT